MSHASGKRGADEALRGASPKLARGVSFVLPLMTVDILIVIFRFLTNRRRILVMSLVCKQWRVAAYRSITGFHSTKRHRRIAMDPSFRALFPCLSHLAIVRDEREDEVGNDNYRVHLPHALPEGLTSIDFRADPMEDISSRLHGLKELDARLGQWVLPYLHACASSLTSLTLHLYDDDFRYRMTTETCLRSLHFPLLESLTCFYGDPPRDDACGDFISAHAATLTRLELHRAPLIERLPPMPKLRHLSFSAPLQARINNFARIYPNVLPISLLSQLTHFTRYITINKPLSVSLKDAEYKYVTHFDINVSNAADVLPLLAPYHTRIASLVIEGCPTSRCLRLLAHKHWPRLQVLSICSTDAMGASDMSLAEALSDCFFPVLSDFTWSVNGHCDGTLLGMQALFRVAPELMTLWFSLTTIPTLSSFDSVCELLHAADRHGLAKVTVYYDDRREKEVLKEQWEELWALMQQGLGGTLTAHGWSSKLAKLCAEFQRSGPKVVLELKS